MQPTVGNGQIVSNREEKITPVLTGAPDCKIAFTPAVLFAPATPKRYHELLESTGHITGESLVCGSRGTL